MARPFSRIDREVLVDNRWHRYCRDRYVQRDGSEGEYFYIDMAGSCGIIPHFPDGTTLLLEVERYLLGQRLFEFPIGGMQPGDSPRAVAEAELREEAGVVATRWDELGFFAPYKGASTERCHFFLARDLEFVGQELEPSEHIEVHRLPFVEARARLVEQECGDGQSLAGLMLLDRWLLRGNRLEQE